MNFNAGVLDPEPWTGTGPWSVRNWATQLEVSDGGRASKHQLYLQPLLSISITTSAPSQIRHGFSQKHEPYDKLRLARDLGCALLPPPSLVRGKNFYHKTDPWHQKKLGIAILMDSPTFATSWEFRPLACFSNGRCGQSYWFELKATM